MNSKTKLRQLIREEIRDMLIVETLDNLKKKFHNKIPDDTIKYFYDKDPSKKKEHFGKFMCNMFLSGDYKKEDIADYADRYYELGKMKKDYGLKLSNIASYEDFSNFKKDIETLERQADKKIKEKERKSIGVTEGKGYKILDQNRDWVMFEPLTSEGACNIGTDSDWCTSKQSSYFNSYSNKDSKLVVLMDLKKYNDYKENGVPKERRDPNYKVQAQVKRKGKQFGEDFLISAPTFMDLRDNNIKEGFLEFFNKTGLNSSKIPDTVDDYSGKVDLSVYTPAEKANALKILGALDDFEIIEQVI